MAPPPDQPAKPDAAERPAKGKGDGAPGKPTEDHERLPGYYRRPEDAPLKDGDAAP
jgi:hypothetical protein